MTELATSPAAAGPAGAHFEAKVGAYYLLALLLDAEPRGLPGARIERIQFQGAGDGFPLDDVIVQATMPDGTQAVAEIQAKRKITFSPSDTAFRDVVEQIVRCVKAGGLETPPLRALAIATPQSSRQIDGAYQEVLLWARRSESADAFFRKLKRPGASNANMRSFVTTLQANVTQFGAASDENSIWKILRKLHILVFDFAAEGQTESLVRDRCARALELSERGKAGALWSALCDIAQSLATSGGEIALSTLRDILSNTHGLKLTGLRQNRAARAVLLEASQHALNDIRDRVGSAMLLRRARLDTVNAALDGGRYLEIRGGAGVGKSGILRALAEQAAMGAGVIVLTPVRTIPRGWLAMRQIIGFDGNAKDLLSDIAISGCATLFLDGVDFFGESERATASDLVREAAALPGFSVVVTARHAFGADEPNWLPAEAIEQLGRAPTVIVDELTDAEIDELRNGASELWPLLADGHPARAVVRNLFRLDRLVGQPSGNLVPHSEAEMAKRWWQTGDGKNDDQARDRTRILRDAADKSLSGYAGPIDTSTYLAPPLDTLVKSGTLLDFGGERMIFRHDVFRDWAIANRLHENNSTIGVMPLDRPAPASLSRGVELAARLAIEVSTDAKPWKSLLDQLTQSGVHGSWCRAVIMGLVRSEVSADALDRAEEYLLADSGRLLRDLIRMLMAIDVRPVGQLLAQAGVSLSGEFAELSIPSGPTWRRLIVWLLGLRERLPGNLVPDVAELYTRYAAAMSSVDPIVPQLVAQLYTWLMAMEGDDDDRPPQKQQTFASNLNYERRHSVHADLRSGFVALCALRPDLGEKYVRFLLGRKRRAENSAEGVVLSQGGLAKAAPEALAELTAAILIVKEKPTRRGGRKDDFPREAFTHIDSRFLSPSPARGPFLDLLMHAPKVGTALIRQVVKHGCTFGRDGAHPADDPLVVEFDDGPRRFTHPDSYYWSREANRFYCVTSALMALEAWGHHRIDSGEGVENVAADILGDGELPAAYLLVITDLLISHWPKSRGAAIPFVGCPELLSLERTRQSRDAMGLDRGMFGDKEPRGIANLESLRKRPSRGTSLEWTLPYYLFGDPAEDGQAVRTRLEAALSRLGPYESDSSMADPRLMVVHALNLLDRQNYRTRTIRDAAGEEKTGYEYVAPGSVAQHLEPMQAKSSARMAAMHLGGEVANALEEPEKSSRELVARSIAWARQMDKSGEPLADFDHSILISAALLLRDGDAAQREEFGAWARAKLQVIVSSAEDPVHRFRNGLRFNPIGIATVGVIAAARHGGGLTEVRPLLELTARGDPAAAHGFGAELGALAAIDPRLPKSLLRGAFVGSVRAHLDRYGRDTAQDASRRQQVAARRDLAVEAEWRWLRGEADEPDWPKFPVQECHVREHFYLGEPPPAARRKPPVEQEFYADHQAAALWLSKFSGEALTGPDWLRPVAAAYRDWTSTTNGAGLEPSEELSTTPREWNQAYYRLVARSISGLAANEIDRLCIAPVVRLPDESFLDAMADLLVSIDVVYLDVGSIAASDVLRVRTSLADRMRQTSNWTNFVYRPGYGIEMRLDFALGALFMTSHALRAPPQRYVPVALMSRVVPFIPLLTELVNEAPSLHTALMALSIVRGTADVSFLAFGVTAVHACMKHFPDDTQLWLDYGVGKQFCGWIESVLKAAGPALLSPVGLRSNMDEVISNLIRLGVPEATALETSLL